MKTHTVIGLLLQTYQFMIIRFLINVFVFIPGYWAVLNGIRIAHKYFSVSGLLVDIAFGYAGLVIFLGYINFSRRYSTHLVRYAQIASVTAIINNKSIKGSMMLYGFRMMFKRFGTVSLVFFSDKMVHKALQQISSWVMEKGDFVPEVLKTGILSKLVTSTLRTVVLSVDEIVVSYMYNNKELSLWQGAIDGISLYVRSWKSILKAAFFSVLWLKIFTIAVNVVVMLFAFWFLWGKGVMSIVNFLILYRVVLAIGSATFVEPYQSISMVLGFYENKKDKQEISGLPESLEKVSAAFRDILLKRKEVDVGIVTELSDLITENLSSDGSVSPFDKLTRVLHTKGGNKNEFDGKV